MLRTIILALLKFFAKRIVRKYSPDVVGITGSIGKTSAKEAIAAVLSSKFNVRSNYKNYNNEIGLPLTIIGFDETPARSLIGWFKVFFRAVHLLVIRSRRYPDILVLEMGSDKPGDIKYLTAMAPCKVGVLTFIAPVHLEFFKTIKKIAQEKRIIISHLTRDDFAVVNYDCDLVRQNISATTAEVITYGFDEGADLRATDVNMILDEATGWPTGLNFKVTYKGSTVPVFLAGVVADHLIPGALAGLSVGLIMGINLVEGAQALNQIKPLPGHMRLLFGIKNTLIVDDTYNSSPEPTKSALLTMAKIKINPAAHRWAVLGDMLELGLETESAHREIGFKVVEAGMDHLVTVGEASKFTAAAAREAGLGEDRVTSFADSVSAARFIQDRLKEGDIILVKGSQGVRMEKVVKEIMAEPLKAGELLVRQNREWMNK